MNCFVSIYRLISAKERYITASPCPPASLSETGGFEPLGKTAENHLDRHRRNHQTGDPDQRPGQMEHMQ